MKISLYIGDELADFNEVFNVMFSIGDIRNIGFGSSNKTYTLNLPLTKTNKRLVKYISQADVKSEPTATGRLYIEELLIISGRIQILSYSDYYIKVIINSDEWINVLKDRKMTALDLSTSDHTLNHANVENSWTAVYPVFRYPMINFGALQSGETNITAKWWPSDFIPMVSISSLITKMLAPYTISSTWLTSSAIKDIFILAKEVAADAAFIKKKGLLVIPQDATVNQDIWAIAGTSRENSIKEHNPVVFNIETTDEGGDFTANVYTVPETGTYRFKFTCKGSLSSVADGGNTIHQLNLLYKIYKKVGGAGAAIELASTTINGTVFTQVANTIVIDTGYVHLLANDTVYCYFALDYDIENTTASTKTYTLSLVTDTKLEAVWGQANQLLGVGKTISLEEMLPDMTQIDFLAAIRDIFNLRFWMDKMRQKIYIEPWSQLLSPTVINLTEYIDFENIDTELISPNYSKLIALKWKVDDSDKAFEEYLESNTEAPGFKDITITSEFAKSGEDLYEHPFSTIITGFNASIGLYNVNTPRIFNEIPVPPYTAYDRKIGFNTRLVKWSGLTAGFTWYFETETKNTYPKIEGLSFTDIYNDYWLKHYHYIDKGKLFTVRMKLKPLMLSQFFMVINTAANEGFRPTYKITIKGIDNYFFSQSITSDGESAELQLVLKQ